MLTLSALGSAHVPPPAEPLVRMVDLDLGESQEVVLSDGRTVAVRLVNVPYQLPIGFGEVQLDSPVTKGYLEKSDTNTWALEKDARIRFWPRDSPWINPGTSAIPPGSAGSPAPPRWRTSPYTSTVETLRTNIVQVIDRDHPDRLPPTIHATYAPTWNIRPGYQVTFKVCTFRTSDGEETWDFGDGSPPVAVKSDNARQHDPMGYAVTAHRYERPGTYLVEGETIDRYGQTATGRLVVRVEQKRVGVRGCGAPASGSAEGVC